MNNDYSFLSDGELQLVLDEANARKDAARDEALAITKVLDARRVKAGALAKLAAAGLTEADLAALGVRAPGDAVATPAPLDATGGVETPG